MRAATFGGLFQQACSAGSAVLLFPFIVHSLSSADSGLWFSFQGFMAIAGLCDFGLGFVVARQTSYSLSQTKNNQPEGDFIDFGEGGLGVASLRGHVEKIYNISGVVAFSVGILLYEAVLPLTAALDGVTEHSRIVWYLMLATGLFLLFANRWTAILNGANNVFTARIIFGSFFLVQGLSVTLAAVFGKSLVPMAILSLCVAIIYCLAVKYAALRTVPALRDRKLGKVDRLLVKRLWKVAVPVGFTNTSSFLISSIQVPMLAVIFGPSHVAPYYLAQKLIQFGAMIGQQPITSQLSRFTAALSNGNPTLASRIMYQSLLFLVPVSLITGASFILLSPLLAGFLAPDNSYPGYLVLLLMATNMVLLNVASTGGQFVMASGKNPFMWVTILNGILNLCALWLLVPRFGLIGI
ncbi:hypothetical protein N9A63_04700, partial [Akkermansiaceae bacterium]|nr:hypothetical protein [Akkermansiaceae bacterium]